MCGSIRRVFILGVPWRVCAKRRDHEGAVLHDLLKGDGQELRAARQAVSLAARTPLLGSARVCSAVVAGRTHRYSSQFSIGWRIASMCTGSDHRGCTVIAHAAARIRIRQPAPSGTAFTRGGGGWPKRRGASFARVILSQIPSQCGPRQTQRPARKWTLGRCVAGLCAPQAPESRGIGCRRPPLGKLCSPTRTATRNPNTANNSVKR